MRTNRRGVIRGGIGIAVGMALGTLPEEGSAQGGATAPPENPPTLAVCLPYLDWDPAARGPLLIVAPERAKILTPERVFDSATGRVEYRLPPGAGPVRVGRNGFRLATISPQYRRKLVATGSLSAVVPDTMAVLRYKNLPEPDVFFGVPPETRAQILLGTLSSAQWGRLMSPAGIGMGDLQRDQQALFAGLFPETTRLYRTDPPLPGQEYGKTELVPLESVNIATVRLRLYQELAWQHLFKGTSNGTLSMSGDSRGNKETTYRLQVSDPGAMYSYYNSPTDDGVKNVSLFGADVLEAQPNRAKPSDIDYSAAAWAAPVPLADAKTVGDLVARVREATGIEIYADKRYAELSVYTRVAPGAGGRSGDLLKALAQSVTGTFRRVAAGSEAAFVMTDDRVGAGTRFAAIGDWLNKAEAMVAAQREKVAGAAQEANVSGNAPWALQDDLVPSPALLERVAAQRSAPPVAFNKQAENLVPLSDLPPGVQAQVRAQQMQWREQQESQDDSDRRSIREEGVLLRTKSALAVVIPGIGTVPMPNFSLPQDEVSVGTSPRDMAWYANGMIPPDMSASLPLRIPAGRVTKRVLALSVEGADEARQAARLAIDHRFNTLLLPAGGLPPKTVAGWVSAAQEAAPGLKVLVRTSLLRQHAAPSGSSPEQETDERLLDRNIMGETYARSFRRPVYAERNYYPGTTPRLIEDRGGDYFAVGDKTAAETVRSRIVSLAVGAPGIAGIVLTDVTPPGYNGPNVFNSTVPPDRELGYTDAFRLAFLREAGADPVDLSPFGDLTRGGYMGGYMGGLSRRRPVRLPYLPDLSPGVTNSTINGKPATTMGAKDLYPRWYDFRAKQFAAGVGALHGAIRSEFPQMEILVQSPGVWGGGGAVAEWQAPVAAPAKITPPAKPAPPPAFRWLSPLTYDKTTPLGVAPMKHGERFARQIARYVGWMSKPPTTPQAKAALVATKYGVLVDLTQAPLADADELLSQIVIGP